MTLILDTVVWFSDQLVMTSILDTVVWFSDQLFMTSILDTVVWFSGHQPKLKTYTEKTFELDTHYSGHGLNNRPFIKQTATISQHSSLVAHWLSVPGYHGLNTSEGRKCLLSLLFF